MSKLWFPDEKLVRRRIVEDLREEVNVCTWDKKWLSYTTSVSKAACPAKGLVGLRERQRYKFLLLLLYAYEPQPSWGWLRASLPSVKYTNDSNTTSDSPILFSFFFDRSLSSRTTLIQLFLILFSRISLSSRFSRVLTVSWRGFDIFSERVYWEKLIEEGQRRTFSSTLSRVLGVISISGISLAW